MRKRMLAFGFVLFLLLFLTAPLPACPLCDPECSTSDPLSQMVQTVLFRGPAGCATVSETWSRSRREGWALVKFPPIDRMQEVDSKDRARVVAEYLDVALRELEVREGELDPVVLTAGVELLIDERTGRAKVQQTAPPNRDDRTGSDPSEKECQEPEAGVEDSRPLENSDSQD
jgi:hypothetical protein